MRHSTSANADGCDALGERRHECNAEEVHRPVLPAELREFFIDKLAEILVLDYEEFYKLTAPTVVEGSHFDRVHSTAA
jgi:hypothetical protein